MIRDLICDEIVPAICTVFPCTFWEGITGINPVIAYYHIVSDSEVPHVKHLYAFRRVEQFKKDIDAFCRLFKPIGLHDLLKSLKTRRSLPRNSFLLTFDDGFSEIYNVIAPILQYKGVPATFFLTTAFLDNKDMAHHNKISLLLEHVARATSVAAQHEIWKMLVEYGIEEASIRTALLRLDYRQGAVVDRVARILNVDFASYLSTAKPYLNSEQVDALIKMGFTIGGHSVNHPLYATLSLDVNFTKQPLAFVFCVIGSP